MKSRIFLLCFSLFALVALGGCKKTELTGDLEIYIGTWESFNRTLELNADGKGNYLENFGTGNRSVSGRIIIEGDRLKITATFSSKGFNIDHPPLEQENDDGEMETVMMLDGLEYIRQ